MFAGPSGVGSVFVSNFKSLRGVTHALYNAKYMSGRQANYIVLSCQSVW